MGAFKVGIYPWQGVTFHMFICFCEGECIVSARQSESDYVNSTSLRVMVMSDILNERHIPCSPQPATEFKMEVCTRPCPTHTRVRTVDCIKFFLSRNDQGNGNEVGFREKVKEPCTSFRYLCIARVRPGAVGIKQKRRKQQGWHCLSEDNQDDLVAGLVA